MGAALLLKLYTDFICPFCYIAEHSTLERLQREYAVRVDWRGFELHPDTPRGGMNLADFFRGRDPDAMHAYVARFAAGFGVELPKPPRHLPNTRMALAVAEYARARGKLDAFRRAAQRAYWKGGKDLEDFAALRACAAEAGLDPAAAVKAATAPKYVKLVDAMREEAGRAGVTGIPTMVFPNGSTVVGCQPYETLAAAARAAGARPRTKP